MILRPSGKVHFAVGQGPICTLARSTEGSECGRGALDSREFIRVR